MNQSFSGADRGMTRASYAFEDRAFLFPALQAHGHGTGSRGADPACEARRIKHTLVVGIFRQQGPDILSEALAVVSSLRHVSTARAT